jgi:tagaturonate reductase
MSIALNSWSKVGTWVLPSILDYKERTGSIPQRLSFSLAATIAFYKGKRGEDTVAFNDDQDVMQLLKEAWAGADGNKESIDNVVTAVLGYKKLEAGFEQGGGPCKRCRQTLFNIEQDGIQNAVKTIEEPATAG